jgi:hypothetical protein
MSQGADRLIELAIECEQGAAGLWRTVDRERENVRNGIRGSIASEEMVDMSREAALLSARGEGYRVAALAMDSGGPGSENSVPTLRALAESYTLADQQLKGFSNTPGDYYDRQSDEFRNLAEKCRARANALDKSPGPGS